MLDLFFALGQVLCLFGLIAGAVLCMENREFARTLGDKRGAIDVVIAVERSHYRPYLFDSWSGLEPSAPRRVFPRLTTAASA